MLVSECCGGEYSEGRIAESAHWMLTVCGAGLWADGVWVGEGIGEYSEGRSAEAAHKVWLTATLHAQTI